MTSSPIPAFPPSLQALIAAVGADDATLAATLAAVLSAAAAASPSVPAVAALHGLVPALYGRLRGSGLQGLLPAEQWETLKASHVRRAQGQQALLDMAADAVARLREAQIPCLPIKGLALVGALGDGHLPREMADVDLLVPADAIVRASRLLQDAGYTEARLPWTLTPWTYGLPPLARGGLPLELHWRLWPTGPLQPAQLPDFATLAATATPTPWAGTELRVPDVPSQLLTVAAAMTVDALAVPLRHWADLVWLRERLPEAAEPRLWELAAAARMEGHLRLMLGLVEELWPTGRWPLPTGAAADTIRRIAWRRLVDMPRATRRASSLLLVWRRLHGAGDQLDPQWRDKLPPELREGAMAELLRGARAGAGATFVAGSKLLRRSAIWLASPAERRALREELALAEALWSLAG